MANFDLVFVYDKRSADEFKERGLAHPKVRKKNEMASADDLVWAIDALDFADYEYIPCGEDDALYVQHLVDGYGICIEGFDWENRRRSPGDHFTIYGRGQLTLAILIQLCERCGQLVLWPDSGSPAIVLDATMNADRVHELHCENEYGWEEFFEAMYGETRPGEQ